MRKYLTKGAGIAWIFGFMMVILVVAVFATGVVGHYDAQTTIVSSSVELYDTIHVAEFTKRTLEGACFVNAKAVAREYALSGGGVPVWTNETPGMDELLTAFELQLEKRMDYIDFDGLSGREITWEYANLTITAHDDNGFSFSGNKSFVVESKVSVPQVYMENQGAFESDVKSSYFKLLRLGLDAAECPAEEGEKTVAGFEENITVKEENKYDVTILDPDSGLELRYILDCSGA